MKIKINVVNDIKESSIKDNDFTEYRNSIKPEDIRYRPSSERIRIIGQPVHPGDVLLIKLRNKLFKCEVQYEKAYNKSSTFFSVRIYPLDKDVKKLFENERYHIIKKRDYMTGIIIFDDEIKDENGDTYWEIDFTKGLINFDDLYLLSDTFHDFDDTDFTVVKFLTKSIPSSAVQDSYSDLTDISQGLNEFVGKCLEFKHLVEYYYKNNLERNIKEEEKKEDELDGYIANPVYSLTKNHLEWVTNTTDDLIYCIQGLIDDLKKGE